MAQLEKRGDAFFLDGREVRNGATLERQQDGSWVADRILVGRGFEPFFGMPATVERGSAAPATIEASACDIRWPRTDADEESTHRE